MTLRLQVIIGICLIIALAAITNMIRKRKLELKYALSWLIAIVFVLILDCFPIFLTKLSGFLGIWAPVNMIFFLGFCFSLLIIFVLTVTLSRMSERVRKLSQAVALNEEKIELLLKEQKQGEGPEFARDSEALMSEKQ
ncbi:MAG: DUF2304 domain-containing protein [Lachnospiraceae bacterium]|nr:DUF2304 domain-containing protein [Lachnospiraceae bacterium]